MNKLLSKLMLMALLLCMGSPCFSARMSTDDMLTNIENCPIDLLNAGIGNFYLLAGQPGQALAHFDLANATIDQSNDPAATNFLVLFGKIIAYDMLGMQDQCKGAMDALLLFLDDEDDTDDEEECDEECQEALEILHRLACLCPTLEVRSFLTDLLQEMQEE